jgi:hypothetical protein
LFCHEYVVAAAVLKVEVPLQLSTTVIVGKAGTAFCNGVTDADVAVQPETVTVAVTVRAVVEATLIVDVVAPFDHK